MVSRHPDREHKLLSLEQFTAEDIAAVRNLLRGGSVIDWHQLDFRDHEDVDRFLRLNEFDPTDAEDIERLEELREEAVGFLARTFDVNMPATVATDVPARDLFLVASREGPKQRYACIVLKVMHIAWHLAGRELLSHLPVSSDEVYRAVELKVMRVIEELRAAGYPVVEFAWSRKSRDSLITKLLVKRTTLAANIYDKLRFRMVVRNAHELVPMLVALHRRLIPFNYVVPGQSVNHLVSLENIAAPSESMRLLRAAGNDPLERSLEATSSLPLNEFSAPEYSIINFVADLPIRVDQLFPELSTRDSRVVFVLTEFQLVDRRTDEANERGPANHGAYKKRQYERVWARLNNQSGDGELPPSGDADD